ncbi:MAG TPA: IPT/TIG domain-containing protein [Thermoanaerobaculia bacterium]|nr:IPT/TIG domain-containing protein [Thermoanaerobaculia bacterium]
MSLVVDESAATIHVLDTNNQRIQSFTMAGAPSGVISVDNAPVDLALLDHDRVAVLVESRSAAVCYTREGASCGDLDLPRGERAIDPLKDFDGALRQLGDDGTSLRALLSGARSVEAGVFVVPERLSPSQGHLLILTPGGEPAGEIGVLPLHGRLETLHFLGRDLQGNLAVVVEESISGRAIVRSLRRYSPGGELLAAAAIPFSNFLFIHKDLVLGPSGCVYQLLPLENEAIMLRWCTGPPQGEGWAFPPELLVSGVQDSEPRRQNVEALGSGDEVQLSAQAAVSSPQEALSRALAYETHRFTPRPSNLTPTGGVTCGSGEGKKIVKTPRWIVPNAENVGIPYKWGGYSGISGVTPETSEDFDAGLTSAKYMGDQCTTEDTDCEGKPFGVVCAVGVDCSGFVTRVWGLQRQHYGTGELPGISCQLPSLEDMLPGDVLIMLNDPKLGSHVRLFAGRDPEGLFKVYESSSRTWNVSHYSYSGDQLTKYLPYRSMSVGGFFSVGDRVQTLGKLNVRPCAGVSCVPAKEEPKGGLGWIRSGPQSAGGYLWWEVQWDDGVSGWAIQCYVEKDAGSDVTPDRPDGLSVTAVSASEIVVTWFDRSNNEGEFRLQRRIGANGAWTTLKILPANTVRFPDTGLTGGELYAYKVRACRGQKCSPFSDVASVRTPVARKPAVPQGVAAATDRTGIRLSWRDTDNLEERFEIERRTDAGSWQARATSPKNSVSFLDSEVVPSQKYFYRMRACNASGCSGDSAEVSARAPAALSPVISRVSPNPMPGSESPQTLSVYGSNFAQNATVKLKNLTAQTTTTQAATMVNSGQLSVSASFTNTNSTWSAQVVHPDGSSSNVVEFQVQVAAALPSISSVSPTSYPVSSGTQTMTINGSGFQNGATLTFDPPTGSNIGSTASKLTFVSSGQLVYQFSNGNDAGFWTVTVTNPDGQSSSPAGFTVTSETLAPSISSIAPPSYPASSSPQMMTINGSNFQNGASLTFDPPTGPNVGSTASKLTFVSSSRLVYQLNNGEDAGFWTVTVTNPDGRKSSPAGFTVTEVTPAPSISSLSPPSYPASSSPQTMTINGSDFQSGATLIFDPPTGANIGSTASKLTYVSSSQLSYQFNNSNDAGTWTVWVNNPDGQSSGTYAFTVTGVTIPAPSISGVSPSSYPASSSNQTMTISGSNFQNGASLTFDPPTGSNIDSTASKLTFMSSSQLVYQFNNGNDAGTWTVRVNNPDGQSSGTYGFTVTGVTTPAPSISSMSPSSYPASSSNQTMTIYGSNFQNGASLTFDPPTGSNIDSTASKLTFMSSSQLVYQFNNGNDAGTWTVRVNNPDGQSSGTYGFTVTSVTTPAPSISSVSPSSYPASSSNQTMTIYGSNFQNGASLTFDPPTGSNIGSTASKLTFVSSSQLVYQFNNGNDAGTWTVRVNNPDGQSSGTYGFTVTGVITPAPSISSVSPSSYPASSSNQTMTIYGSNFQSGASLTFDPPTGSNIGSTASKLTFVSSSQLVYQFNNGNDAGTWTVRVNNPDGQSSGTYSFTVTGVTIPAPSISSVSPSSYPASSSNQTMTINGSNFQNGATLTFDPPTGSNLNSNSAKLTFVSSSKLTYLFNNGNDVGVWTVKVNNPDGQSSSTFSFTVY